MKAEICHDLELNQLIDRKVEDLSSGELQHFAISVTAIMNAKIYMFDEPSSFLDVKQRLKAAQVIRSLLRPNRFNFLWLFKSFLSLCSESNYISSNNVFSYVIVVEHDLSVLDYLSDFICCLYGKPGAYGVVPSQSGKELIFSWLDLYKWH